jgi:hypothetical protein
VWCGWVSVCVCVAGRCVGVRVLLRGDGVGLVVVAWTRVFMYVCMCVCLFVCVVV